MVTIRRTSWATDTPSRRHFAPRALIVALIILAALLPGCLRAQPPGALPPAADPAPAAPPPQAPAPTDSAPADPAGPAPEPVRPSANLVFVGDIMLDRLPGEAVARGEDPFASFADVLLGADLAVGNLECVIATGGQKLEKLWTFRCHPRNVPLLARYFGAVSVANNHSGDYGPEAFVEQLGLLEQGGVPYMGGGRNLAEAHRPLYLERGGLRIALLAYNEVERRAFAAGPNWPGHAWSDDDRVVADIRAARQQADLVVVYPHWGPDYITEPTERQQSLARTMVDAGAQLIVGGHPHVTQTVEWYQGALIVYSLGNFVFDDFLDVEPELDEPSRTSWVLQVKLDQEGVAAFTALVARTDDSGIPRPVRGAPAPCGSRVDQVVRGCTTP